MTPETYEFIIGLLVEELKKKTQKRSSNGQFIASPTFTLDGTQSSFTHSIQLSEKKPRRARDGKFLPARVKK